MGLKILEWHVTPGFPYSIGSTAKDELATMADKPITILNGHCRVTTDRNAKLFYKKGRNLVPRKDGDLLIAVFRNGLIFNRTFDQKWFGEATQFSIPIPGLTCECGKENHGFANHSDWCDIYKLENGK